MIKLDAPKVNKHARSLMLWTKSGIVLQAKATETPQAYELLRRLAEAVPDDVFNEIVEQVMAMKCEERMKKVYVLDFGDKVKIGVSEDVRKRKKELEMSGRQEAIKEWSSAEMPSQKAFEIEKRAHAHFDERRVKGEYFSISFGEARDVVQRLAKESAVEVEPSRD